MPHSRLFVVVSQTAGSSRVHRDFMGGIRADGGQREPAARLGRRLGGLARHDERDDTRTIMQVAGSPGQAREGGTGRFWLLRGVA